MARPDHQTSSPPLPVEDQQVTIVSVLDGQISVLPARVLVAKTNKIALELEAPTQDSQSWSSDHVFTVLYTRDELILRLRAQLAEHIDAAKIAVTPLGPAKEGDRRDFRRADMTVRIFVRRVEASDSGRARELQLAEVVEVDHPGFVESEVNISGSGVSFTYHGEVAAEELMDVRLVLSSQPTRVISFIGSVVRAGPLEEGGGRVVALRFNEFSEAHQDAIIYAVFSQCFAESPVGEDLADFDPLVDI